MSREQRILSMPLALWVAAWTGGTAVAVLVLVGLLSLGTWHNSVPIAIVAGFALAGVGTGVAVAMAVRFGGAFDRLADQIAPRRAAREPILASAHAEQLRELRDLTGLVDALDLRARVAEEAAEQALRTAHAASAGMFELLSGLVAAEEAARGQLSADLHDTTAQTLIAARAILANPEGQQGAWERVRDLIDEAEEDLRAAMARTRPPGLQDRTLASASADLRREMASRYLLDVTMRWPDEPRPLPMATAIAIYRFFQEALINIVKHADVDEALASLDIVDDVLVAKVSDKGPGFDLERAGPTGGRHLGLTLMRDRARLAGGSLDIDTGPAGGTTLTLRLPLAPFPPTPGGREAAPKSTPPTEGDRPAGSAVAVDDPSTGPVEGADSAGRAGEPRSAAGQHGDAGGRQSGGGAEQVAPGEQVGTEVGMQRSP